MSFWANGPTGPSCPPFILSRSTSWLSMAATWEYVPTVLPLSQDEDRMAVLEEVIRDLPGVDGELPADRRNLLRLIDGVFGEADAGDGASLSLVPRHPWLPRSLSRVLQRPGKRQPTGLRQPAFLRRSAAQGEADGRARGSTWLDAHLCRRIPGPQQGSVRAASAAGPAAGITTCSLSRTTIRSSTSGTEPVPKRFRDLLRDYDVRVIPLPENYRCPPDIVSLANRLIERNCEPGLAEEDRGRS